MKRCPFCAEDIQDAAIVCKHCGRDLKGGAAQVQLVEPKKHSAAMGCLSIVALLVFMGWCSSLMRPSPPTGPPTAERSAPASVPAPPPAESPETDRLALMSSRGYESETGNYWYVEGQVRNISTSPIKGLMAVATWYGKDSTFIKADSAMVDFDPLLPGQVAPFKTISRGNPAMSEYTVQFKTIFGGLIHARDDRKKK